MGRRYGDQMIARAEQGEMAAVAERDKRRIERLDRGRRSRILGPGTGESGRSEMVRFGAHLYVPEGGSASSRDAAGAISSGTSTSRAWLVSRRSAFEDSPYYN